MKSMVSINKATLIPLWRGPNVTPMSLSRVSFTLIYTDNKGLCNRHTSVKSVLGLQKLQTCEPAHQWNSCVTAAEATSISRMWHTSVSKITRAQVVVEMEQQVIQHTRKLTKQVTHQCSWSTGKTGLKTGQHVVFEVGLMMWGRAQTFCII